MTVIRFSYRDAKGDITERELIQWTENTSYIQGRAQGDTFPKTFRKDRIVEFSLGEELLLNGAAPPAPKPRPAEIAAAAALSNPQKTAFDGQNKILFTGFSAAYRVELEQLAEGFGMNVIKTPSKSLTFLCYGDNAGPTKVSKAQEAGAFIIDSDQFLHLVQTGELP